MIKSKSKRHPEKSGCRFLWIGGCRHDADPDKIILR
jgi:hypothetical protein